MRCAYCTLRLWPLSATAPAEIERRERMADPEIDHAGLPNVQARGCPQSAMAGEPHTIDLAAMPCLSAAPALSRGFIPL